MKSEWVQTSVGKSSPFAKVVEDLKDEIRFIKYKIRDCLIKYRYRYSMVNLKKHSVRYCEKIGL
jgi:hypothetical protein